VPRHFPYLQLATVVACALLSSRSAGKGAQQRPAGFIDPLPVAHLAQLFPSAVAFTPRGTMDPLYFAAYAVDPASPRARPIGYAFWTTDLVPEQLGYHGHIHMLIGMDTAGRLTGVIVDRHTEPYGDFSIEPPPFGAQFKGKSVRDRFEVGADIDAVSRATITIRAAAREVRDSARMVARAVLDPATVPR
jgi:NosR/NirI family transcriptional regulator, nitrous oxide reductase regulator